MNEGRVFSFKIETEGEWTRFLLSGPVTEDAKAHLQNMFLNAGPKCILDFRDVTFINSCGIRDWSLVLKESKPNRTLVFDGVPDDVICTMNMVKGFRQGLPVRSVIRVYECQSCDEDTLVQLTEGKDYKENQLPKLPPVACSSCGAPSRPLEPDEDFFMFLLA